MSTWHFQTALAFILAAGTCSAAELTLVSEGRPGRGCIGRQAHAGGQAGGGVVRRDDRENLRGQTPGGRHAPLTDVRIENGTLHAAVAGEQPAAFVLIGRSELTQRLGVDSDGLGPGGIRLRALPNVLVLLGPDDQTPADPAGTRYAVTTFLEDVLGVRCLWPGDLGWSFRPAKRSPCPRPWTGVLPRPSRSGRSATAITTIACKWDWIIWGSRRPISSVSSRRRGPTRGSSGNGKGKRRAGGGACLWLYLGKVSSRASRVVRPATQRFAI